MQESLNVRIYVAYKIDSHTLLYLSWVLLPPPATTTSSTSTSVLYVLVIVFLFLVLYFQLYIYLVLVYQLVQFSQYQQVVVSQYSISSCLVVSQFQVLVVSFSISRRYLVLGFFCFCFVLVFVVIKVGVSLQVCLLKQR